MPDFNTPLSSDKADRLISLLDLRDNASVVDAGCGNGEFLIRVVEAWSCHGTGIDIDAAAIQAARKSAAGRISDSQCMFLEGDMQCLQLDENTWDLAVCLGATHAFGEAEAAWQNTLQSLCRAVRPGGQLLMGEGYWKQRPDPEYVRLIGEPVGVYRTHEENVAYAESLGLIALYAAVSSDDEWDHFEWSHRLKIEREEGLSAHGTESDRLRRSRDWRNGYLRWGRDTMGFGFYLFGKPPGEIDTAE